MTTIGIDSVAGEQPTHKSGQAYGVTFQKKVTMIWDNSPSEAVGSGVDKQSVKTLNEITSVVIVKKYICPIYATNDDMLQQTGDIQAGLSRHGWYFRKRCRLKQ